MTINIDTSGFEQLLYLPTGTVLWRLFFWYFGWMPVAFVMLYGIIQIWLKHRRDLWSATQPYMVLAIDVPRNNIQSSRAVENLFIYFGGAHGSISLTEKWLEGKYQLSFSFEVVSIDGYIQFLIRTPVKFRNLVETAIYSQYPDAEVYEVEDYVRVAPDVYPNDEYDLWGAEFVLVTDQLLPIRTYPEFEHQLGAPETHFRDPMASLMDLMSSLHKGEQLWYQIVLVPIDNKWTEAKKAFIGKMLGEKKAASKANDIIDKTLEWMSDASEHVYQLWGDIDSKKKDADPLKMMNLKPGEKAQIEGVERKIAKLGYEVSIRAIYLSRKEVMNVPKAVAGFVGYIKQFNTGGLNALKPDTKITMTSANYFFVKQRLISKKNKIMRAYKARSDMRGRKPWVLNVEELATLWHFPIDSVVKAPLIQRASARRVEPPMSLPFGSEIKKTSVVREPIFDSSFEVEEEQNEDNLKIEEDGGTTLDPRIRKDKKQPGFMDEEVMVSKEKPEDIKQEDSYLVDEPEQQVVIVDNDPGIITKQPAKADKRGQPPSNLPFAE